jgi:hypothetical protein
MDLSQHADEKVRRAYDFVRRSGQWGERVIAFYEQYEARHYDTRDSLAAYIKSSYSVSYTQGEAGLIATYLLACREVEQVIARL